jgi:hypothetical protein
MTLGLSIAPWLGTPVKARVGAKGGLREETVNVTDGR